MEALVEGEQELYGLISITDVCNNDCEFCDLGKSRKGARHRKYEQIRKQMEALRERGVSRVALTGGEPTLHPDLLGMVSYAKSIGFSHIRMYTHGRALRRNNLMGRLLDAGLTHLMISLFGPDKSMHEEASGDIGSYEETISGIEVAARADVHLVVNCPVTSINVHALKDYLNVLDRYASPDTIWQLSDLYPTSKVLRDPQIHADYGIMMPILDAALTEATIRGRRFLLQEFPLCTVFPWHTDAKELGWWNRIQFLIGDWKRPDSLWSSRPWVAPHRFYTASCDKCTYRNQCLGIPNSYAEVHPDLSFVTPI
jgi:MoaA/NifB/PqqE/SkfB family radical SAM enzyme